MLSQKSGGVAVPGARPSTSAGRGVVAREGGSEVKRSVASTSLMLSKKVEVGEERKAETREEVVVVGETLSSGDGARSC
jgi:hypothetical protein